MEWGGSSLERRWELPRPSAVTSHIRKGRCASVLE